MCPREFTRSFGFWNSGVAKNGDGVRADGILGSSSWRRKDSRLVGSANRTLRAGVLGTAMAGVFFFRALDRLKVVVGERGHKLLVGVAGVLVTSGPDPPGIRLSAIVSLIDDVCLVLPDAVVGSAGLGRGRDSGVW